MERLVIPRCPEGIYEHLTSVHRVLQSGASFVLAAEADLFLCRSNVRLYDEPRIYSVFLHAKEQSS
jgi:hypothetical protein